MGSALCPDQERDHHDAGDPDPDAEQEQRVRLQFDR
jgi:hypothetical protein